MKRKRSRLGSAVPYGAATIAAMASMHAAHAVPIGYISGIYTQNFDTLATSGTSSALPLGWAFLEGGGNANSTYSAGTGSGTAGDTYSFGPTGNTDRALGTLLSGTLNSIIGAEFQNDSGNVITELSISYTGEQWRRGNNVSGAADRLAFSIGVGATGLNSGTFVAVSDLDFTSRNTGTATGTLNGNDNANRETITHTITGLNIAAGQAFWIRWVDTDLAPGADDGLAIDDFSLSATALPPPPPPPPPPSATALVITGIVDGNLSGGSPKFVEVVATEDIADLSAFSLQLFANGSASPNNTNALPSVALSAGDAFYIVASNPAQQLIDFNTAFPGQTVFTLAAANFNGDDVIRLIEGTTIIDQFGVVGVDGTGEPWEYTDSYAFRLSGFGPNQVFTLSEWTFGGPGVLPSDLPGMVAILGPLLGQYEISTGGAAIPEPVTFSMLIIGGVALMSRRRQAA